MKRQIIHIDEDKCDGCGLCIDACHEGALQLVDGKARLVKDSYCDGLGNCLGECPRDAITIEERDADPFDEEAVQQRMAAMKPGRTPGPGATPPAGGCPGMRLMDFAAGGDASQPRGTSGVGCPGSRAQEFGEDADAQPDGADVPSQLRQWPVQLALVPPSAPYWNDADLLVAADCVAHAYGNFHGGLLKGRRLVIVCPKLDAVSAYVDKMTAILQANAIRSIVVARMEVPCCGGIVNLVEESLERSGKQIPFDVATVGIRGDIVSRVDAHASAGAGR